MLPRIKEGYRRYVERYTAYLKLRGYGDHVNDGPFFVRSFLTCWAEPGFHRFWRVWNPGISYWFYRLYRAVGGRRHRVWATLVAFEASGIAHTLVVYLLLRRWSFVLPVTFFCFGVLALASRTLERVLRQERWPAVTNVLLNAALIVFSYDLGFRVDRLLRMRLR